MLFNSWEFLLLYLPVVLAGFFVIGRRHALLAAGWLVLASLFFYAWWNPRFVFLLLASIAFNHGMSIQIDRCRGRAAGKWWLATAVAGDLLLLGIFKYTDFLIGSVNTVLDTQYPLTGIILPLGISFFTFTQIAFLVDVHRGIAREYNIVHYLLFVTYFPHLIAGPVLHHKQMMPQFAEASTYRLNLDNIAIGITIFLIGLFKKVVLADGVAEYASPVFNAAASGQPLTAAEAWSGTLAYTLQIYFDFSGYSDMAIGLSRLFNVKLPLNFHSPYKASNIIEFWRRWHMTLSQFLRDYLYISLGGNRFGTFRRYRNLFVTMLLGGIWHGAGWNFAVWGALHGSYLIINHGWRALPIRWQLPTPIGTLLTFIAVMIAWVFFRAPTFDSALHMLSAMGNVLSTDAWSSAHDLTDGKALRWFVLLMVICWWAPNTQELLDRYSPAHDTVNDRGDKAWRWQPSMGWAIWIAVLGSLSLLSLQRVSEFLYFQF